MIKNAVEQHDLEAYSRITSKHIADDALTKDECERVLDWLSGKTIEAVVSKKPSTQSSQSTWVCKECGQKNESNKLFCKDCGTFK